jgi:hypothetical protein
MISSHVFINLTSDLNSLENPQRVFRGSQGQGEAVNGDLTGDNRISSPVDQGLGAGQSFNPDATLRFPRSRRPDSRGAPPGVDQLESLF